MKGVDSRYYELGQYKFLEGSYLKGGLSWEGGGTLHQIVITFLGPMRKYNVKVKHWLSVNCAPSVHTYTLTEGHIYISAERG